MASGNRRNGKVAVCPACGSDILFRNSPKVGRLVTCRICDSLLEVVSYSPLELEWAFEDSLDDYYQSRHEESDDLDDWDEDQDDEYLLDYEEDNPTLYR